jgi:hypothetical protein
MLLGRNHFALLLAFVLCSSASSWAQQTQEQSETPQPVPTAPTLAQVPAGSIITLYQNGLLTIEAQNGDLGDVLRAVSNETGAVIDMPPGTSERVIGVFGPGRPRDVLVSLLNGSHFNYVMQASAADPNGLARVTLSLRLEKPGTDQNQSRQKANQVAVVNEGSGLPQENKFQLHPEPKAEPSAAAAEDRPEGAVNDLEVLAAGIAEQDAALSAEQANALASAIAKLKGAGNRAEATGPTPSPQGAKKMGSAETRAPANPPAARP